MKQSYIVYWEGINEHGNAVVSGNEGITVEYSEYVNSSDLLPELHKTLLASAKAVNDGVVRAVIKGMFKL